MGTVVSDQFVVDLVVVFVSLSFVVEIAMQALKASRLGEGPGEKKVEVVIVNHPSPASPSGIKWEKATCMDELILASSLGKEIDRFLA